MSRCRSCRARIRWVHIAGSITNKTMPLDAEPHPHGNIVIRTEGPNAGRAEVLGKATSVEASRSGAVLYQSHFATCPNADDHRKGAHAK